MPLVSRYVELLNLGHFCKIPEKNDQDTEYIDTRPGKCLSEINVFRHSIQWFPFQARQVHTGGAKKGDRKRYFFAVSNSTKKKNWPRIKKNGSKITRAYIEDKSMFLLGMFCTFCFLRTSAPRSATTVLASPSHAQNHNLQLVSSQN